MVSDDPEFEEKAADIIGLYLKPPAHALSSAWNEEERHPSVGSPGSGFAAFSKSR
jgi:hypothetical protein